MDVVVRRTRLAVAVGPFVLRRVLRDLTTADPQVRATLETVLSRDPRGAVAYQKVPVERETHVWACSVAAPSVLDVVQPNLEAETPAFAAMPLPDFLKHLNVTGRSSYAQAVQTAVRCWLL